MTDLKSKIVLIICICLFGISHLAGAQQLRFDRISDKEGLYKRTITCGLQDKYGFMWFGSEDGLLRYDGYVFKEFVYNPDDVNSLSSNFVYSLLEDRNGQIWIGTVGGGLNRYDPISGTFTRFMHDENNPASLSHNGVVSLLEDSKGRIWAGTEGGGLNRLDPGTDEFYHYKHDPNNKNSISFDSMWHLYEDSKGQIWIGTHGGGLNVLSPDDGVFRHFRYDEHDTSTITSDVVGAIFEDSQGNFWVGSIDGLNLMDREKGTFTRYQHDAKNGKSLPHNHVWDIYEDENGYIWLGSFGGGISRFQSDTMLFEGSVHQSSDLQSLSSNLVWCFVKSKDGVLWIGTDGGGLNKFNNKTLQFNHYTETSSGVRRLTYNGVNGVDEDSSGRLWMANDGGGLQYFDPVSGDSQQFVHNPEDTNSISSDLTETLLVDHQGIIWIGTYNGGLNAYNHVTKKFTHYVHDPNDKNSLSDNRIWALFEDSQHFLWIGTRNGLNRMDPSRTSITRFIHDPNNLKSLSDDGIWTVYEDKSGKIWVGTDNGLNSFDENENFEHFFNDPGDPTTLSHNNITTLLESNSGIFWIGTNGGLCSLNRTTGKITRYTARDGLESNSIRGILEDSENNLWITTVKGLTKFTPQTGDVHIYRYQDGLQGTEFSRANHRTVKGEIVVGGRNGINIFNPLNIKNNTHIPPVVLTSFVTINNSGKRGEWAGRTEFSLSYQDTTIMFNFAALDYNNSAANQYQYKLEGFDSEWVHSGNRHQATYTNLGGGEYTFKVRASNNHGVWNMEGLSLPVSITYYPWQRWWAYTFYILVLTIASWLFLRMKGRQHHKELLAAEKANFFLKKEVLEREKVEKALIASEQRLILALDAAQEGIWEFNPKTGNGYYSPSWFTILGYPVDAFEHTYDNWSKRIHPDDKCIALDNLNKYFLGESEHYEAEFRMHASDGSWVWIYSTGRILEYDEFEKPEKIVGIHINISSRKATEKETQRLQSALQHASKMEAIGTLAGGVAHDFNNILSVILGNCELGMLNEEKGSPAYTKLYQILQAGCRARDLIQQILTFSRKDKRKLEAVYVEPMLEECLGMLRSTLPASISIIKTLHPNVKPVLANPSQIHQVIVNLCTNASHAMEDDGGVLSVGLKEIYLSAEQSANLPGIEPGFFNQIQITDTGKGIDKEDIGNIFNPYFSTKKQGKGTGLGLSVVLGIVQNCGGAINVESIEGLGATFTVMLPSIEKENMPQNPSIDNDQLLDGESKNCTILLVDDEPVLVDIIKTQLESDGHTVVAFTDANKALAAFVSDPFLYDIVFTDMAMPEISGEQVAKEVKRVRQDIPIILCTGYSKKVFAGTPQGLGVDVILKKPFQTKELLDAVSNVLFIIENASNNH